MRKLTHIVLVVVMAISVGFVVAKSSCDVEVLSQNPENNKDWQEFWCKDDENLSK